MESYHYEMRSSMGKEKKEGEMRERLHLCISHNCRIIEGMKSKEGILCSNA